MAEWFPVISVAFMLFSVIVAVFGAMWWMLRIHLRTEHALKMAELYVDLAKAYASVPAPGEAKNDNERKVQT